MCLIIRKPIKQKFSAEDIRAEVARQIVPTVASEDIKVVKVISMDKDGKYVPRHFSSNNAGKVFEYKLGETYTEPGFATEDIDRIAASIVRSSGNKSYHPGMRGFGMDHPLEMMILEIYERVGELSKKEEPPLEKIVSKELERVDISKGFHSWKQQPNEEMGRGAVYSNFTIPKGALFFSGEDEMTKKECYCSNMIRFDSIIASVK
jgi:hypothetical protein